MSGLNKITIERNQKTLLELAVKPGNDICADCKARNPRWASHNLGIFICVNCASIHRKIGTHITKVKSLTMDSWTKEQVESMKNMGNLKSNAIYNPNEIRNPPPPNLMDSERDSELEQYIRSKYEYKRFFDKAALVASKLGPSRSASSISSATSRSVSTPLTTQSSPSKTSSTVPPIQRQSQQRPTTNTGPMMQTRSVSQPLSNPQQPLQPQAQSAPASGVWADLVSLQTPSSSSSLPLQFQTVQEVPNPSQMIPQQGSFTAGGMGAYQSGVNPFQRQQLASNPYSQQQPQQQFSSSPMNPSPFSAGAAPSFTPNTTLQQFGQQQLFQPHVQPPMSAPGQLQGRFFQPQPQQGHLQGQVPAQSQSQYMPNTGQSSFMSAPPGQGQFLSSSPGQQFLSHSPQQPQMQMLSSTPQPQMQTQMPSQQGHFVSHSPQPQMGMGMGMGMMGNTPQGQFMSTTSQPQMQMQPGQFMPGTSQPQGPFGGQGQMFTQGGYPGQQWGGM